jgi:hypothetical protein
MPRAPADDGPPLFTIAGLSVGGSGVVTLAVATYLGVRAWTHQNEANEICATEQCNDQAAVDLNQDARTSADWSTGLFVAGGVAAATGIVLLILGQTDYAQTAAGHPAILRW